MKASCEARGSTRFIPRVAFHHEGFEQLQKFLQPVCLWQAHVSNANVEKRQGSPVRIDTADTLIHVRM